LQDQIFFVKKKKGNYYLQLFPSNTV